MAIELTEDSFGNFTADIPDPRSGKAVYLMVVRCEDAYWLYVDGARIPGEFPSTDAAADAAREHVSLRRRSRTEGTTRISRPAEVPILVERRPAREPFAYAAIAFVFFGVAAAIAFTDWGQKAVSDLVSDAAATTTTTSDVSSLESARPAPIPLPVRPVRQQATLSEQHLGSMQQTAALTDPAKVSIAPVEATGAEAKLPALPIRFDQFDASALAVGSEAEGSLATHVEPEDVVLEIEGPVDSTLVAHEVQETTEPQDVRMPAYRKVAALSEVVHAERSDAGADLTQSDVMLPYRKVASLAPTSAVANEEAIELPARTKRRPLRRKTRSTRKRVRVASLGSSHKTSTSRRKTRASTRRVKPTVSRAAKRRALKRARRASRKTTRSKTPAKRKVSSSRKRVKKASRKRRSKGLVVRKSVYRLSNGRKVVRYRVKRPRTKAQYRQLQRLRNRIIASQLRSRRRRMRRF